MQMCLQAKLWRRLCTSRRLGNQLRSTCVSCARCCCCDCSCLIKLYGNVVLWLQFAWEQRVCLNGKDLRVWSAVRGELQRIFWAAWDFVQQSDTSATKDHPARVNALELAPALCETCVNKPVMEIIMDSEESLALRRVAAIMTTKYSEIALPLKTLIASFMHLNYAQLSTNSLNEGGNLGSVERRVLGSYT